MSMVDEDCTLPEQKDLAVRYVAGRLGEPDAAAFETHLLSCESCWTEVRTATEVRAARGLDLFVPGPASRGWPWRDTWTLLAAAAAVAVMAIGLRQLAQRGTALPETAVFRSSAAQRITLSASSAGPGRIRLRWPAVPETETYLLEVFASDGATVLERETSATSLLLEDSMLPPRSAGISLFA